MSGDALSALDAVRSFFSYGNFLMGLPAEPRLLLPIEDVSLDLRGISME